MIECRVLRVDKATCCIEAAFLVKESWILNRIHHPVGAERKPLDLGDQEAVNAYVEQYARDNYEQTAHAQPADPHFVEDQFVRTELQALRELSASHANTIAALSGVLDGQGKATAAHWNQASVDKSDLVELISVPTNNLIKLKQETEEREKAADLVFEELRSQLRVHAVRFTQVEADLNGAWWRRAAAWVKTNSSLLGGKK